MAAVLILRMVSAVSVMTGSGITRSARDVKVLPKGYHTLTLLIDIMKNAYIYNLSLCMRKPTIWVSDQVQHKPACTVTEETQDLENLGISRGENVLSV